ncbi:MAG: hypothetical protein WBM46_03025 [Polyangiales bacterium]
MNGDATRVLLEETNLSFSDAAVCLHFQERLPSVVAHETVEPYDGCAVLQSMERDLLSLAFQQDPPVESHCLNQDGREPTPIEVVFPETYSFYSEGREEQRRCVQQIRKANAMVSYSYFRHSRTKVWHLALVPDNDVFTELDIIRLIHLYAGGGERSSIAEKLRFNVSGLSFRQDELLAALVSDLRWEGLPIPTAEGLELQGGTVSIVTRGDVSKVLETTRRARQGETDAANQFDQWMEKQDAEWRTVLSLCGIVTGIFDFVEVDEQEALDTLQPTFSSSDAFYRINRNTFVKIAKDDRAHVLSRATMGISPYLAIPHAVLIHNAANVENAEKELVRALGHTRRSVDRMERARGVAERRLQHLYVPNVFNYETERTLYERGREQRGDTDRLAAVTSKLDELLSALKAAWDLQHDRGQKRIAMLVIFISAMQLQESIASDAGGRKWLSWGIALVLGGVFAWAVYNLWGSRRVIGRWRGKR